MIGSGVPRGRFIEVIGQEATTKSAFAYAVIGAFQRAGGLVMLIDSEQKTDRTFAEKLGADFTKLGYSRGETIKEVVQIIGRVAQMAEAKVPTLVVWDSIAATRGADELATFTEDNKDFTGEKAARARYLSAAFRAVMGELAKKKVTFLAVNQLRTQFNFMGSTSQISPGGKAPKYAAGVRLMMRRTGNIKHKEADVVTGIQVAVEAIKNSCSPPFRKCTVRFKFDSGFDLYSGLDELLLRHGRLEQKAGWLSYKGKMFRSGELERVIAEMPDLLDPITTSVEKGGEAGADNASLSSATTAAEESSEGSED